MSEMPPENQPPLLGYKSGAAIVPPPPLLSYNTAPAADYAHAFWVQPDGKLACRAGAVLPHICVACGDTNGLQMKRKEFVWVPSWVYLGLLGGLLPAVILSLVMQRKALVTFGLCAAHRKKNMQRVLIGLGGTLLIPVTLFAAVYFESGVLGVMAPLELIATLIYLTAVKGAGLTCSKIDNQIAYLTRGCPMLLKVVQNTQDAARSQSL